MDSYRHSLEYKSKKRDVAQSLPGEEEDSRVSFSRETIARTEWKMKKKVISFKIHLQGYNLK